MSRWLGVASLLAMIVTVVVVFAVRMTALRFGIQAPTALDLPRAINRVKARPRGRRRAQDVTRRSRRRIGRR